MLIYGHRGAAGLAAENTIESIRTAMALGVDGVEVDVRCSRDGIPVIMHDATLDRTTNGQGPIHDQTILELLTLTVGQTASIPTLEEVLKEVGASRGLNIEVKEVEAAEPTAQLVRHAMRASTALRDQLVVSCVEPEALRLLRQIDDTIPVALLTKGLPPPSFWRTTKLLTAVAVHIDVASVATTFVEKAHTNGLQVMVYTVNTRQDARRMNDMGVDGIFSDFPDRVHP